MDQLLHVSTLIGNVNCFQGQNSVRTKNHRTYWDTRLTMTQQRHLSPGFCLRRGGGCTRASERVENKDSILCLAQKAKAHILFFLKLFLI